MKHEHQFPEEETPEGVRILFPCLLCGLAAADGLLAVMAERGKDSLPDGTPDGTPEAERAALLALLDAYEALKQLGWRDAIYSPKDGTWFDAIEVGSTGIHNCHYEGPWPGGHWCVASGGEVWPFSAGVVP